MESLGHKVTITKTSLFRSLTRLVLAVMVLAVFSIGMPTKHPAMADQASKITLGGDNDHVDPQSGGEHHRHNQDAPSCCEILSGGCIQFAAFSNANGLVTEFDLWSRKNAIADDPSGGRTTDVEPRPPRNLTV